MDDFLKEVQDTFLLESQDLLLNVEALFIKLEKNPNDVEVFNQLSRLAHNLKGSGKAVGFEHIATFSHELENLMLACKNQKIVPSPLIINLLFRCVDALKNEIDALRNGSEQKDFSALLSEMADAQKQDQISALMEEVYESVQPLIAFEPEEKKSNAVEYLRIPALRIEALIDSFGEQVILQSALEQAKNDVIKHEDLIQKTITQLSKLTYELQQTAISLRVVNLNLLYSKLERVARDTSQSLAKPVIFITKGGDKELDKTLVDSLSDVLTHMLRNAIDHGIESVEERMMAGKSPEGLIEISAQRSGGNFVIEMKDDGRGMDLTQILVKAKALKIVGAQAQLSDKQILDLIFENGFSTKDTATDISGRGVGMNVVKEKVIELKGTCEVESRLGMGTCFRIQLPLNLAIFNAMIIKVGHEKFVVPTSDVDEVSRVHLSKIQSSGSKQGFLELRDQVYSIVDLRKELFQTKVSEKNEQVTALLIRKTRHPFAVLVDEVMLIQKVVHKPLSKELKQTKGTAGATILGDGQVCMILNLSHFAPKLSDLALLKEAS